MAAVLPLHPHTPIVSRRSPALCFLFLRFPDIVITNVQARWTIVDYEVRSTWTQTAGDCAGSAAVWQKILCELYCCCSQQPRHAGSAEAILKDRHLLLLKGSNLR